MKYTLRAAQACLFALCLAASVMLVAVSGSATAAGCAPGIGKKVPVVLVHGFNSKPAVWDEKGGKDSLSMAGAISVVSDLMIVKFNYEDYSLRWVADPNIGKRLASQITCLAQASHQQGGSGKVIVVAHSMGGLATRQAIVEDPAVAKALGLVITIGTPNTGSDIDRHALEVARGFCNLGIAMPGIACHELLDANLDQFTSFKALAAGSKELRALPPWPRDFPVTAIAGNVAPTYAFMGPLGVITVPGLPSGSDSLVTTQSALHFRKVAGLGDANQLSCRTQSSLVVPFFVQATCEHSHLVKDPAVKARVVSTIKNYLRATAAAPKPAARALPEVCNQPVVSSAQQRAQVIIRKGSVTCDMAVRIAKSFLDSEIGSSGANQIGIWGCSMVAASKLAATCSSKDGQFSIAGV